jgi:hypothetical protein
MNVHRELEDIAEHIRVLSVRIVRQPEHPRELSRKLGFIWEELDDLDRRIQRAFPGGLQVP